MKRTDLKCPVCKTATVIVNRTTGEIKTCLKCVARNVLLRSKYGLTRRQYDDMLYEQGNKCAICTISFSELGKEPSVDHCHDMLHVRGLLCSLCNTLLGTCKDDENILYNAAKYLKLNRLQRTWSAKALKE